MHYIGIDWGLEKHNICVLAADGKVLSEFRITHDWKGFERLEQLLSPLRDIQVNIERQDGLLVDWLSERELTLFVTHPNVIGYRRPRRSKDDRGDAHLLATMLRMGDPEVHPMPRQSALVKHLKQLVIAYDDTLNEQRRLGNRLIFNLRQYYPAVLEAFGVPHSLIVQAFLEAYPTPEASQALTLEALRTFLRTNGYSQMQCLEKIYAALQTRYPRASMSAGHVQAVLTLAPLLRALHQQRSRLKKEMLKVFKQHPDAAWWRGFPGAHGELTPVRLLAWIGDDRSRFPSPEVLQAIAGTAPITRRSGKQQRVEFRHACSHPLRNAVDDLARHSLPKSGWARSYFYDQIAKGHGKSRAYRALANRWLKIIWTLWKSGEKYDEAKHLANRSHHGRAVTA